MLGKMLIYNLISYNIVCNTNTTTNANEIKALTHVESEIFPAFNPWDICMYVYTYKAMDTDPKQICTLTFSYVIFIEYNLYLQYYTIYTYNITYTER